jgi:hypothetical protein
MKCIRKKRKKFFHNNSKNKQLAVYKRKKLKKIRIL